MNKIKIGLTLVAMYCGFSINVSAQTAPNLVAIQDSVTNPSSNFYYEPLFARYQVMDTTLTIEDYHYLYYGYPVQPTYMPLLDNNAKKELEDIMGKRTTPTTEDLKRAIELAQSILAVEPFNLRDINALAFLYSRIGMDKEAEYMMQRMDMIVQTIKATGEGLSEESPWWVTYFNHAIDVLALMNCEQQTPIIVSSTVEFIPVSKMKPKKYKGYYFNYSEIYAHGAEYLKDYNAPKRQIELKPWQENDKFKF